MTAIYTGAAFTQDFLIQDADEVAIDITGYEFEAQIRDNLGDTTALLDLTTANGGLVVTDGAAGRLQLIITSAQSTDLPVGRVVFDVLHTNASPGPKWMFGGNIKVKQPVTRE